MFFIKLRKDIYGFYKYSGSAEEICAKIVNECFNGEYFQVSATGHYNEFWIRDIGWCADSLIKLGYEKELRQSILYALDIYNKNQKITTTIARDKVPYDFPNVYSVDSLPYLIRTLRLLKANDIIKKYKKFLDNEIKYYFSTLINPKTGLVKKGHYSQMRDHSITDSSCYANVMAAMLKNELEKIKILENPLKKYNYEKIIIKKFWNGEYFLDDLSGGKYLATDANLFQFYFNIMKDKKILKKVIDTIKKEGLDKPLPLIYTKHNIKELKITNIFTPNWQRESVWPQLGMIYLRLLKDIDKKEYEKQKQKWKLHIEKYHNVFENYDKKGKPYCSLFYTTDESMLWACMYLTL